MIICSCHNISEKDIRKEIKETKSIKKALENLNIDELYCGSCQSDLIKILKDETKKSD